MVKHCRVSRFGWKSIDRLGQRLAGIRHNHGINTDPLRVSLDIFRGGIKIGRIVFDGKEPGGLWEPTAEFEPLRELFETQDEYTFKAGEDPDNEAAHYAVADRAHHEIHEPGVEARGLDGRFEFEIIGISVYDGRVTWR